MPVLPSGQIINDQGTPTGQTVNLATNQVNGVINSSVLNNPPPALNISTPNTPSTYDISKLTTPSSPALAPTAPENQANELVTRLGKLYEQNVGQSEYQAQQNKEFGVGNLVKSQNDLTSQLQALTNESQSLQNAYNYTIPNTMQEQATGRGITAGGLLPLTASELRKNQIQQGYIATKALTVKSALEAVIGNLATAKYYADQAVAQKFNPIKEQVESLKENLDLILKSPAYSLADKNRAEAQKEIQDARMRDILRQEDNYKAIQAMVITALKNNPGNQGVQIAAQQAQDLKSSDPNYFSNAIKLVGQYQPNPAEVLKDADAHLLAQQQILEAQKKVAAAPLEKQKMEEEIKNLQTTRENIRAQTAERYALAKKANEAAKVAGMGLTNATKTMLEAAPQVVRFVDKIQTQINDAELGLGPIASRWQEFTAGKIGFSDPSFTKLRTDVGLLTTLLMRMHVGARGGEYIMKHFEDLVASSKQSPENLTAALGEIKSYANDLINERINGMNFNSNITSINVRNLKTGVIQPYNGELTPEEARAAGYEIVK